MSCAEISLRASVVRESVVRGNVVRGNVGAQVSARKCRARKCRVTLVSIIYLVLHLSDASSPLPLDRKSKDTELREKYSFFSTSSYAFKIIVIPSLQFYDTKEWVSTEVNSIWTTENMITFGQNTYFAFPSAERYLAWYFITSQLNSYYVVILLVHSTFRFDTIEGCESVGVKV